MEESEGQIATEALNFPFLRILVRPNPCRPPPPFTPVPFEAESDELLFSHLLECSRKSPALSEGLWVRVFWGGGGWRRRIVKILTFDCHSVGKERGEKHC